MFTIYIYFFWQDPDGGYGGGPGQASLLSVDWLNYLVPVDSSFFFILATISAINQLILVQLLIWNFLFNPLPFKFLVWGKAMIHQVFDFSRFFEAYRFHCPNTINLKWNSLSGNLDKCLRSVMQNLFALSL